MTMQAPENATGSALLQCAHTKTRERNERYSRSKFARFDEMELALVIWRNICVRTTDSWTRTASRHDLHYTGRVFGPITCRDLTRAFQNRNRHARTHRHRERER